MKKMRTRGVSLAMYEKENYEIHHQDLHDSLIKLASTATRSIEIFTPYIKKATLVKFIEALPNRDIPISVITTWNLKDLVAGITDLDVYPYCKEQGIFFFINNRIHLNNLSGGLRKGFDRVSQYDRSGNGVGKRKQL